MEARKVISAGLLAALLLGGVTGVAGEASAAQEGIPFTAFGYGDRTAHSMYGSLEYFFPIPQDWILTQGSQLQLVISHSPLARGDRSTLTALVNDVAVHSAVLDESNAARGVVAIPLPVDDFADPANRPEGYAVRLQFFMRLTDLVCEETTNPAQWATVHAESSLNLMVEPRDPAYDLAEFPFPFVIRNQRGASEPLTFSLEPSMGLDDLDTALWMAAYLGRQSSAAPVAVAARVDGQVVAPGPHIAVGLQQGTELSAGSGQFQLVREPWGDPTLHLLGEIPATAVRILNGGSRASVPSGDTWTVLQEADESLRPSSWAWKQGAANFSQLGAADRTVRGVGEPSTTYFFKHPAGWDLTPEEIFLDLHLSPSPLLEAGQSGARISINGFEIAAISFAEDQGKGGFYRIALPVEILQVSSEAQYTQDLTLGITFQHNLPTTACEPTFAENAWTVVHSDSYFFFPHESLPQPDISTFPHPFVDPAQEAEVRIALPIPASRAELTAALLIARSIGARSFGPLPSIAVIPADESSMPQGDLILIGSPERNALVASAEAELSARDAGLQQPTAFGAAIANLKSIPSPWDADGHALILMGDDKGLIHAAEALAGRLPSGSILAVRQDGSLETIKRSVPPPELPGPYTQLRTPLIPAPQPWQVVFAILGVSLLGVALAFVIARIRSTRRPS